MKANSTNNSAVLEEMKSLSKDEITEVLDALCLFAFCGVEKPTLTKDITKMAFNVIVYGMNGRNKRRVR